MSEENDQQYHQVDPEDFYGYEERFIEKGGGGGKSSSEKDRQGQKTRRAARRRQIKHSRERQRQQAREKLLKVIKNFPDFDHPKAQEQFLKNYAGWVNRFLEMPLQMDPSELEFSTSKSSGPGGQNVNKRETRVALRHIPTWTRAVSDQARTQRKNRKKSRRILKEQLQDHLDHWRAYLSADQKVDPEMILGWLEKTE